MKIFRLDDRLLFWNLEKECNSMYCLENRRLLCCVYLRRMRIAGPVSVTISMMV